MNTQQHAPTAFAAPTPTGDPSVRVGASHPTGPATWPIVLGWVAIVLSADLLASALLRIVRIVASQVGQANAEVSALAWAGMALSLTPAAGLVGGILAVRGRLSAGRVWLIIAGFLTIISRIGSPLVLWTGDTYLPAISAKIVASILVQALPMVVLMVIGLVLLLRRTGCEDFRGKLSRPQRHDPTVRPRFAGYALLVMASLRGAQVLGGLAWYLLDGMEPLSGFGAVRVVALATVTTVAAMGFLGAGLTLKRSASATALCMTWTLVVLLSELARWAMVFWFLRGIRGLSLQRSLWLGVVSLIGQAPGLALASVLLAWLCRRRTREAFAMWAAGMQPKGARPRGLRRHSVPGGPAPARPTPPTRPATHGPVRSLDAAGSAQPPGSD